jgi:hypothetical protein
MPARRSPKGEGICDKPWFPRVYTEVHHKLAGAPRKVAFVASALSELVPIDDEVAKAARTHFLYEALHTGGVLAQGIVAKCVRDLSYLIEAGAPRGKWEQPNWDEDNNVAAVSDLISWTRNRW